MRKVKNLKGYRQKPTIYGLNTTGFIITTIISVLALLSFLGGITVQKVVLVTAVIAVTYFTSLLLANNKSINEWLFDENLPQKFSNDE
ncbi:hypothetical protein [Kaistella palustris]|uniref:hypothetical protein n=1 Tax=Kaistella palustris TaxID=493376 RepID=UPI00040193F3|nr:hypothetical protein [Kaistella palustris]